VFTLMHSRAWNYVLSFQRTNTYIAC